MSQRRVLIGILVLVILSLCACSRTQPPDDKRITDEIQSKLYQDDTLKKRDISLVTQNGVVVLSGQVASEDEKASAESLAASAGGVKQVVNQLAVVGPSLEGAGTGPKASAREQAKGSVGGAPAASSEMPPPPKPVIVTIPAGTTVTVQMVDSIDSKTSQPGSEFAATLAAPLAVGERVIFGQGSEARVQLQTAKQAGRMKGSSELQLGLVSLTRKGQVYPVQSGSYQAKGESRGKQTGKRMGIGALAGGVIGGIAGGGKGVAIGAAAGAGGGALVQAVTKGKSVKVPSETKIDFKLAAPIEVTLSSGGK